MNPSFCRSYLIVHNEDFIKKMLRGAMCSILTADTKLVYERTNNVLIHLRGFCTILYFNKQDRIATGLMTLDQSIVRIEFTHDQSI